MLSSKRSDNSRRSDATDCSTSAHLRRRRCGIHRSVRLRWWLGHFLVFGSKREDGLHPYAQRAWTSPSPLGVCVDFLSSAYRAIDDRGSHGSLTPPIKSKYCQALTTTHKKTRELVDLAAARSTYKQSEVHPVETIRKA